MKTSFHLGSHASNVYIHPDQMLFTFKIRINIPLNVSAEVFRSAFISSHSEVFPVCP